MTPQELRKSVLLLAFKGKLVSQNKEESSYNLLSDVLKHGFSNKKYLSYKDDLAPYDIPENWLWCMFHDIVSLENGEKEKGVKLPYLEAKYLRGNSEAKYLESGEIVKPGSKVILVDGENSGEVFFIHEKGYMGSTFKILNIFNSLDEKYVLYFMKLHQDDYRNNKKGAAIPHLNKNVFFEMPFPLAPLEEQKRIVAKIEELLPLIDKYGEAWEKLEEFNASFPIDMKKSILQTAMKGKLVKQLPFDESSNKLLENILIKQKEMHKKGLIPKPKQYGKITDDEIPFEIPDNWVWARLADVAYNHGQETPTYTFSYIDIGSIDNVNQKLNENENLIEAKNAPSRARKIVKSGDIIYSTVRPYLHNMCIIDREFSHRPIASTGFAVLCPFEGLFNKFLFYYLLSPQFDEYANRTDNSKGVAYPAINDEKLFKAVIPLPPLEEQKRIVAKIEELLPLCKKLIK